MTCRLEVEVLFEKAARVNADLQSEQTVLSYIFINQTQYIVAKFFLGHTRYHIFWLQLVIAVTCGFLDAPFLQ